MNNQELTSEIARRSNFQQDSVSALLGVVSDVVGAALVDNQKVTLSGFGTLEVCKNEEYLSVDTATQKQILIPPQLVATFKPSSILTEKF